MTRFPPSQNSSLLQFNAPTKSEAGYNFQMYGEDAERWRELARQALEEEDEEKFVVIIQELNEILERRRQRLKEQNRPYRPPSAP